MSRLRIRAGTTFNLAVRRVNNDGSTFDITNTNIKATLRAKGWSYPLQVMKTEPENGWFVLSASASDTRLWKPGLYTWDILYDDAGVVESIPTKENLILEVFKGATS